IPIPFLQPAISLSIEICKQKPTPGNPINYKPPKMQGRCKRLQGASHNAFFQGLSTSFKACVFSVIVTCDGNEWDEEMEMEKNRESKKKYFTLPLGVGLCL